MLKLKFIVLGDPLAKKRHRHFARIVKGKIFQGTYSEQKGEESGFIDQIIPQLPKDHLPIKGAIYCHLFFGLRRPKSHYGTGRNSGKLKPSAPKYPAKLPDFDNLEKFAVDSINKIVFEDDKQIVSCRTDKRYSERPRTEILIKELD
jgi:Holliday junction resolvase RusA-like endonuclease